MKNIYLLLFLILSISPLLSQKEVQSYDKLLSPETLKEDLQLLKYNLETVDAGLYTYSSKEIIDAKFAEIESQLDKPMTAMDFNRKLCSLNKMIGNGHSNFEFSEAFVEATQKILPRFPLKVYKDGEKIFVLENHSENEEIQAGWQIKSINGENVIDIFNYFVSMTTRDGYNITGPEAYINKRFSLNYAFFKGFPEKFDIVFENKMKIEETLNVKAILLDKIKANRKRRYGEPKKPWYALGKPGFELEIKDEKTAILTIRTFSSKYAKKSGVKTKKFFQEAFEKITAAGIENLIIDMRDNGGGDPSVSVALFSHLLDKPFTFYKEVITITRKIPNPKNYKETAKMLNLLGWAMIKKKGNGLYTLKTQGIKPSKSVSPVYKGKLYVLVNGVSFSQTGETAGFLKSETDAVFIGTEVGGNSYQNTSGVGLPLELPNSKNIAIIPLVLWKMNVDFENTGHGVIPDHIISPSINDVISGRDNVMEFALELVKN